MRALKLSISLLWFLMDAAYRSQARLVGRRIKPRFTVLYYHGISDAARASFARQMTVLARRFTVLPAGHTGPLPDARPYCVAITFDDAFRSVAAIAATEIEERALPATVFAPVGYLGQPAGWIAEGGTRPMECVMSAEELRGLPAMLDVGSHTVSHPHLRTLDDDALKREIRDSRTELSRITGREIRLLAFPYGEFDDRAVQLCREAGYSRTFSIQPREADRLDRDFVRGRIAVEPSDGRLEFALKARGAYSWMPYASAVKARIVARRKRS